MSSYMTEQPWGLPAPDTHPEFYADTVLKRAFAWLVDVILIFIIAAIAVPLTAFIGAFFFPLLYAVVSFVYRWWSLAAASATPGMRLASVELRTREGARFDAATAFLHTAGYFVSVAVFPLQLVSIVLMLISDRKQGLTDHILGTAAINRAAAG